MWELLKTVSLLKSEFIKDNTKLKKLTKTKNNCKKHKKINFLLNSFFTLKFLTPKKIIKNELIVPKKREL